MKVIQSQTAGQDEVVALKLWSHHIRLQDTAPLLPYPIQSVKMLRSLPHDLGRQRRAVWALSGMLLASACSVPQAEPSELWDDASVWQLSQMQARVDDWAFAAQTAESLPLALLVGADSLTQRYRLLVVAEERCIDSAHSLPYFDALAKSSNQLELRVVDSQVGRGVLDRYRTPDGRGATPTVVVLDDDGTVRGCWIERPADLQSWWVSNPDGMTPTDQYLAKTDWYRADRGRHAVSEVLQVLRAADQGAFICGVPLEPSPGLPQPGLQ